MSVGMICILVWFGLLFYVSLNNYDHVGTASSPNHILVGKFELAVNQYFVRINSPIRF